MSAPKRSWRTSSPQAKKHRRSTSPRWSKSSASPATDRGSWWSIPTCRRGRCALQATDDLPGGQRVEGGSVLSGSEIVPGLTAAALTEATAPAGLTVERNRLENDLVRVEIAEDGTLTSVFDKRAGREALDGRGNQIWAYVDKPRNWDAWDVEDDYARNGEEVTASSLEVVEEGPHRAAIRIHRRFRNSEIVQTVRLWANSARVDFKTDIDWHDRRILLKARFPLAVRSDHATFECAHGIIRRATHRNTSWDQARFEVAAHRFVDLAEHGYGVALLNDGKYGHHALGNELGISLLRSPVYPDPLADEGRQSFTYALYPHDGDWLSGGVLGEAEDLNQPLFCRPVALAEERSWTAVGIDGMQLGLSAFKPAEDGSGLILRALRAGRRARHRLGRPVRTVVDCRRGGPARRPGRCRRSPHPAVQGAELEAPARPGLKRQALAKAARHRSSRPDFHAVAHRQDLRSATEAARSFPGLFGKQLQNPVSIGARVAVGRR